MPYNRGGMKNQIRVLIVAAVVIAVFLLVKYRAMPAFERSDPGARPVSPEAPGELGLFPGEQANIQEDVQLTGAIGDALFQGPQIGLPLQQTGQEANDDLEGSDIV